MRLFAGLSLALVAGLAVAAPAKPTRVIPVTAGHLAPRDQCASLPGATAFRTALAAAVRRRSADAMAALSAEDIVLGFGGESGPRELKQLLSGAEAPALWLELDKLLALGCAVQDGELVLPWFFAQDIGENENYDRYLVAGANVPLYEARSHRANVSRQLSWVLVRRLDPASEESPRFTRVRLESGAATGFVETGKLRSPGDYRLGARRVGKNWRITFFVSGD